LAALANFFDSILSPIASIARGFGPMKMIPSLSSASQKDARSERNP
jgi:hypothetical protein